MSSLSAEREANTLARAEARQALEKARKRAASVRAAPIPRARSLEAAATIAAIDNLLDSFDSLLKP